MRGNLLDLFSGIGGFHLGLEQAGFEFDWVGFSEIDKYAKQTYSKNFPNAKDLGDVRTIRHKDLPQIDIITFGSPCQDFSIAGKRAGLDGNRSSLIGEAIRLITECKPRFFIWENVKGTFSSNNGEDFWEIIKTFTNIGGYRLEWQLLNTRWFLPQNRERIYLVGCLGEGSGRKVFPIGETGEKGEKGDVCLKQVWELGRDQDSYDFNSRVYSDTGIAKTLTGDGGNNDNKTGLYQVGAERGRYNDDGEIEQQLEMRNDGVTNTLTGVEKDNRVVYNLQPRTGDPKKGGTGQLSKDDGTTYCLDTGNTQAVTCRSGGHTPIVNSIRRLTPTECERLQGFPDGWTEGQSDTQRYKQLGNAVSVPVVKAVGERLV